jgi:hypothetical protein
VFRSRNTQPPVGVPLAELVLDDDVTAAHVAFLPFWFGL